jgi:hypothetical protein
MKFTPPTGVALRSVLGQFQWGYIDIKGAFGSAFWGCSFRKKLKAEPKARTNATAFGKSRLSCSRKFTVGRSLLSSALRTATSTYLPTCTLKWRSSSIDDEKHKTRASFSSRPTASSSPPAAPSSSRPVVLLPPGGTPLPAVALLYRWRRTSSMGAAWTTSCALFLSWTSLPRRPPPLCHQQRRFSTGIGPSLLADLLSRRRQSFPASGASTTGSNGGREIRDSR